MVDLLNNPSACLDNGTLLGADREAYRSLLETAEPAWACGEILNICIKSEGALTNRTTRSNPLYDAGHPAAAAYSVAESRPLLHQSRMEVAQFSSWL